MKTARHMPSTGFTLLELLISLTIISIIVVIISAALRIGVRAWEKGEQDIEARQRYRIVLDMMKRQLASASLQEIKGEDKKPFSLKGDNKSLTFLSHMSLVPGNRFGAVYVKYIITQGKNKKESLAFYEKNIVLLEKDADLENPNEEDFHELIPSAENIEFEYMKKQTPDIEWQDSWEPQLDKGIPLAIKIILTTDHDSEPVLVIVRIEQERN